MTEPLIRWLSELSADMTAEVGGKAANLGELQRIGVRVPAAFCVTVSAYRSFMTEALTQTVAELLSSVDFDALGEIEAAAKQLKRAVLNASIPETVTEALRIAWGRLEGEGERKGEGQTNGDGDGPGHGAPLRVAVRSSALLEDQPEASFAGQLDTILNVASFPELCDALKHCWSSVWNTRALIYRENRGFDHAAVGVAVVVQQLLDPDVAGVLFTTNPITLRDDIVIDAVWGLGELLVGGEVTPDSYVIRRRDLSVAWRKLGTKERKLVPAPSRSQRSQRSDGTRSVPVPPEERERFTLSDAQLRTLARTALTIEAHYAAPQDLEWALVGGRFYYLQARPITTLSLETAVPAVEGEWSSSPLDERIQAPLTAWEQAVLKKTVPKIHSALESFGLKVPAGKRVLALFYGRPYMNKSLMQEMVSVMPEIVEMFFHHQTRHGRTAIKPKLRLQTIAIGINLLYLVDRVHRWWYEYLREFRPRIKELGDRDIAAMAPAALVAQLETIEALALESARIHFQSITFAEFCYQLLDQGIKYFLRTRDENLTAKLIAGIPGNKTVETNAKLWELSETARTRPAVARALTAIPVHETPLPKIRDAVADVDGGGEFLEALDRFLEIYGHRTPVYSFLHPSWREEPRQVLELVKGYLEYGTEHNPKQHEAEQIAARREATRFVLRRLTHGLRKLIPFQRLVFKTLLRLTHAYARLRENQQFYVGMTFPIARQTMLALGRTLVDDGVITDPIHGFFLTNEELRAFVDGSLGASDLRRRYRSRLAEYERFASYDPPKLIGGAAGGTRPAPEEGVETLSGAGVSAGVVHGQAKVVRNPDEFDKIKRGDILVAPTTTPTWTPLFVMASGLVTDIGGTLSHGAVVSREYGIPAVMGTGDATQVIEDGDWIVVDGERGLVWKTPPPDETA